MSDTNPTLLRLFGRSRYISRYRPPDEDDTSVEARRDRQERERWIVAALGHVLAHDEPFRKEFWTRVCCLAGANENPDKIDVVVEHRNSADLCLTASGKGGTTVCVIEAKTGAKLADHQNPDRSQFWADKGYGTALQKDSNHEETKLRYVVLGRQSAPPRLLKNPRKFGAPIQVLEHSWSTVANIAPQSDLVQDLFDTLAAIKLHEFTMNKLKSVRITEALQAVQAKAILEGVCDDFEIRKQMRRLDNWYGSPADFCLGIYIKSTLKGKVSADHKRLIEATKTSKRKNVAWFGFGVSEDQSPTREVWLYADTLKTAETIKQRLETSKMPAVTNPEDDPDGPYAKVSEPAGGNRSDVEFFKHILNLVAGETKR